VKLRICPIVTLVLIAAGQAAHALPAAETAVLAKPSGPCPEGHPRTGDLGIRSLVCVSGSCAVNMWTGKEYVHEFSTEPRIRGLSPRGPSAGKLEDGDIIIAIDDVLITTREGGRRLANLEPGVRVTLRIRRDGEEMDVELVPREGCNMPMLAVLGSPPTPRPAVAPRPAMEPWPAVAPRPAIAPHPAPPARPASTPRPAPAPRALPATPAAPPAPAAPALPPSPAAPAAPPAPPRNALFIAPEPPFSFGLGLECGRCGWRFTTDKSVRWSSAVSPRVRYVEPGGPGERAGLQPGDVLLEIAGHALNSEESGRAIGSLRPGAPVTLKLRRGREEKTVKIMPAAVEPTQRF
jgi:membrane-associated protease RseP (regulator of RpoE activity)